MKTLSFQWPLMTPQNRSAPSFTDYWLLKPECFSVIRFTPFPCTLAEIAEEFKLNSDEKNVAERSVDGGRSLL